MTHSRLAILGSGLLFLSACSAPKSADLKTLLQNPLYAERYYDSQVDHMVDLIIDSGALLQDPSVKEVIDNARVEGLKLAREATTLQTQGKIGGIISDTEEVMGEALILNNVLYIGPAFQLLPGIDTRLYLSEMIDPRESTFPDETAVEIGGFNTAFGASTYELSVSGENLEKVRSLVFYDRGLNRIVGFAQMQSPN